jgi:hypothetical protein
MSRALGASDAALLALYPAARARSIDD